MPKSGIDKNDWQEYDRSPPPGRRETLPRVPDKLRRSLKKNGFFRTLHLIIRNIILIIHQKKISNFDRRHKIDTSGNFPIDGLKIKGDNKAYAEGYFLTPDSVVTRYLSSLPIEFGEFVFVDIGSGKGRIMFLASNYSFKKIIGLEFAEELHEQCVKNIRTFENKYKKCDKIESVCVDALCYDLENENFVIFMFNPFHEEVVTKFVDKIRNSFLKYGKKIYIGYYNPKYGRVLERQDFLKPVSLSTPLLFVSVHPTWPFAVFETV